MYFLPKMRRVARIALGSFALVLALAGGLFARGWYLVHRSHDNPPSRVVAARDPESVERGRHLVQTVLGCGGCHASRADEIAKSVQRAIPDAKFTYAPDPVRQGILDSWPKAIDDGAARRDWGWKPKFDLDGMTDDLIPRVRRMLELGAILSH